MRDFRADTADCLGTYSGSQRKRDKTRTARTREQNRDSRSGALKSLLTGPEWGLCAGLAQGTGQRHGASRRDGR